MKIHTTFLVRCFLAIAVLLNYFSTKGQTLLTSLDSNCNLTIQVVDTNGIVLSQSGSYIAQVGSLTDSNLVQASTTLAVGGLSNGRHLVAICELNGACYIDSIIINCGQGTGGNNNYQLVYNLNNASSCGTCNGQATLQGIIDPNNNNQAPSPYSYSWTGGMGGASTGSNRTNLCPNTVYTVVATDANQNSYTQTIMVGCNTTGNTNCVQDFDINLDVNGLATVTAQDLNIAAPIGNPIDYIIAPTGIISSSYTFDCQDLGKKLLTLIKVDTTINTADTCSVWVTVTDSNNVCGGYGNQTGNYTILQAISTAATNCAGACNGAYTFGILMDTATNQQPPAPLTYVWNDGNTNASRSDLCPFYQYTLNVYDAHQNHYSIPVSVGCDSLTSGSRCIDSTLINSISNCAMTYQPVCGCNQVSYANSCIAQNNGVSTWTAGVCAGLQGNIQTTPAGCDTTGTICNGTATATGSGANGSYNYVWNTGDSTATINGLCPGVYTVTISSIGTASTLVKTAIIGLNGCVWPGDSDNNTVANNWDLLPIALAYGQQGFARNPASSNWGGFYATNWNVVGALAGLPDYKHIDCDGNGLIDLNDAAAIAQNYGQSYVRSSSTVGQLPIYVNSATGSPKDKMAIPINLGTVTNVAADVYGLAFTINYDADLVEYGSVDADFLVSWLGNDLMDIRYDFGQQGKLEVAVARKDRINVNGYGQIGTLFFTIREDILRSAGPNSNNILISIDNIRVIDKNNNEIGTDPIASIVTISPITSIAEKLAKKEAITVFPNPAKTSIQVVSNNINNIETIQLYTTTGQLVKSISSDFEVPINVQNLPEGLYILAVQTNDKVYNKSVHISR